MPGWLNPGAGVAGYRGMHTCKALLALAFVQALTAAEATGKPSSRCEALKYLTTPGLPLSMAATVTIGTGSNATIRDVEFDYDGHNVRGGHYDRAFKVGTFTCVHERHRYRYMINEGRGGMLTEVEQDTVGGPLMPSLKTAAQGAENIPSLGLGMWLPGNWSLDGDVIQVKDIAWERLKAVSGTVTVDGSGLLRTVVLKIEMKEGVAPGFPSISTQTVTYQYDDNPAVAKGFPTGWTSTTTIPGMGLDQRRVTVHRWSNQAPPAEAFAPSSWAPRIDRHVRTIPALLREGPGALQ